MTHESVAGASTPAMPVGVDEMIGLGASSSRTERRALGEQRRHEVPLESHASVPTPDRREDAVDVLVAQDQRRLADLVPIRHGRMSGSAFAFYRGAAAVMAADLATLDSSAIPVQLCGDAHLANFGLFNGPDRRLVFDLNDFDETHPGPFEWDVKRLAASIAVAAHDMGISDGKARRAVLATVERYRTVLAEAARADPLRLHYHRLEVEALADELEGRGRKRTEAAAAKARRKNSLRAFSKLTTIVDGHRRIVDDPPLVRRLDVLGGVERHDVWTFYGRYLDSLPLARRRVLERYRVVDVAHKVVGVGSVGTRCLIVLCETGDGEPLVLQFKEATASVLERHLGASEFAQAGQRVVEGQRLMQATGDVFLGWARFDSQVEGRPIDFYFRQLWDGKGSADLESFRPRGLRLYGALCGGALALAHARTGDAAVISGYLGDDDTFDRALADFADAYVELNAADHRSHGAAIERGVVPAVHDI